MKVRDVLVIVFTSIVAVALLCRASHADGSRPVHGAGGGDHETSSNEGEGGQEGAAGVGWRRRAAR